MRSAVARNHERPPSLLARRPTLVTFVVSLVAMGLVLGVVVLGVGRVESIERAEEVAGRGVDGGCFGAAALDGANGCPVNRPGVALRPSPVTALSDAVVPACMLKIDVSELRTCEFGAEPEVATEIVALVGDSHAGHWRSMVDALAARYGWRVVVHLKGTCPFTMARRAISDPVVSDSCDEWNRRVLVELEERGDVTMVFTSGSSINPFVPDPGKSSLETGADGYLATWAALPESVHTIVALRDVPRPRLDNIDCLQSLGSLAARVAPGACATPRGEAIAPDPLEGADPGVGE